MLIISDSILFVIKQNSYTFFDRYFSLTSTAKEQYKILKFF